jgi:dihydrofolate reductase
MRKVILDLAVTLDGFIEGPNGEVDWCIMDDDMGFDAFLDSIDTIFYGRKSYDLWGEFQPSANTSAAERTLWANVHSKKKYVFSRSLRAEATTATVIFDNLEEQVNQLKATPGKNIWLYGGAGLITSFLNLNLIDEMRLSVHPILLGSGKPIFKEIRQRKELQLLKTNTFRSGVVQLCYQRGQ